MDRIVVGVDGSAGSKKALQWALDEARRRKAAVDVVHAWHPPYFTGLPYMAGYLSISPDFQPDALEAGARHVLEGATQGADRTGVAALETVLVRGPAVRTLLDVANGAKLLVLGSKGRSALTGLLVGSVGDQVLHHAPCPVVVVPAA